MSFSSDLMVLVLVANALAVPFFAYLLVVSLAALLAPKRPPASGDERRRFLIIIPAHDEEAGIASTVRSCLEVAYPRERFDVQVIADNCTDATASIAREQGAIVVERDHPTDRSKGHALKFLFDQLRESRRMDELDAVVVIDADTTVAPNLLSAFDSHLGRGYDWVQAYDTVANTVASWRTQLMTYSFSLINGVLLRGQTALGLSAGLRGNGMCFSTRGLEQFPWRSYGLVEDIEYSWLIRIAGEKVAFAPETAVYATMLAHGGKAAVGQRRRWESGRRDLQRRMLGPLLRSRKLGPFEKLAAVLELEMPTVMALGSILVALTLASALVLLGTSAVASPVLAGLLIFLNTISLCGMVLYGLAPFALFGLGGDVLLSLLHVPAYALWKLSMVFHRRPSRWVRTAREPVVAANETTERTA
jgi:cellulose synthase/poly-beta-1,6-N-acetylglucosamine synthase-like glycosyltransferase